MPGRLCMLVVIWGIGEACISSLNQAVVPAGHVLTVRAYMVKRCANLVPYIQILLSLGDWSISRDNGSCNCCPFLISFWVLLMYLHTCFFILKLPCCG